MWWPHRQEPRCQDQGRPQGTPGGSFLLTFAPACEVGPFSPPGIGVGGSAYESSLPGLRWRSLELAQVTVCSPAYPHRSANFRSPGIRPLPGGRWIGTERRVL